ncbi:hypothetical protein [Actinomadura chokoriensis]|uniref:Uncharacterized protein n=1 Tax=Actinomadura chokoriensis TaxID=454156 RepID=A0ABV4QRM0_9ACTN
MSTSAELFTIGRLAEWVRDVGAEIRFWPGWRRPSEGPQAYIAFMTPSR